MTKKAVFECRCERCDKLFDAKSPKVTLEAASDVLDALTGGDQTLADEMDINTQHRHFNCKGDGVGVGKIVGYRIVK